MAKNGKIRWLAVLLALTLLSFWGLGVRPISPAAAAPGGETLEQSLPRVIVIADPHAPDRPVYQPPPEEARAMLSAALEGVLTPAAEIQINFLPSPQAWPSAARTAFEFARDVWATQINSPVPIQVDAYWEDLSILYGDNVLGAAGPTALLRDFPGAIQIQTLYPSALANRLAGTDLKTNQADIEATFNSTFPSWYFGLDGNPGPNYDFVSVVMHEFAHGLGMFDSFEVISGLGVWGNNGYPFIYDRFLINGSGQALLDTTLFANPSPALAAQLTSNNVFFTGLAANAANAGAPVKLYAPYPYSLGSSIAHLDEIYNGTSNALMTYSLAPFEAVHDPGELTLGVFADLGWGQVAAAATATPAPTEVTPTPVVAPTRTPTATSFPPFTPEAWMYLPSVIKR
ncbi:MAG TPA: hypothetical protein VLS48_04645 [Anaerolineales bacterium]|nr:hypothetical protein [Anaerolineales bacterium]